MCCNFIFKMNKISNKAELEKARQKLNVMLNRSLRFYSRYLNNLRLHLNIYY
jgi:hypothetical protein